MELFLPDLRRIKEASLKGKLVIFVGSGISMNSGLPSWDDLINKLCDELPDSITNEETDKLKLAQIYKNSFGTKDFFEKIKNQISKKEFEPNLLHQLIIKLNPSHIVTTNYDNLIEKAAELNNKPFFKVNKDSDLPYSNYSKLIIKMHGDLDAKNIVLTEDDYFEYSTNFPLIESFVKSLFASHLILFVGFSFNDINLKIITNKVKKILDIDEVLDSQWLIQS